MLACSAPKDRYRQQLIEANDGVQFVFLKGSYDLIWSRISERKDHYMKPHMLQSQFEAMEEPDNALTLDASKAVSDLIQEILEYLKR